MLRCARGFSLHRVNHLNNDSAAIIVDSDCKSFVVAICMQLCGLFRHFPQVSPYKFATSPNEGNWWRPGSNLASLELTLVDVRITTDAVCTNMLSMLSFCSEKSVLFVGARESLSDIAHETAIRFFFLADKYISSTNRSQFTPPLYRDGWLWNTCNLCRQGTPPRLCTPSAPKMRQGMDLFE